MSDIEQRVKKIVAEQLGVAEADIKNESSFVDDLGADSLDTVELVMALEDEFEMEIPDEQAEKITTVQQAIEYAQATSRPKLSVISGEALEFTQPSCRRNRPGLRLPDRQHHCRRVGEQHWRASPASPTSPSSTHRRFRPASRAK